jgi:hypothetical protein
MDRFVSQQSSGSPAVRLAGRLLAEAEACPALIVRTERGTADAEPPAACFPALALLADPVLDVRPYLDDLVSIAARSAQRAEAVSRQARRAIRKARHEMLVIGCLGVIGLIVGVAGFASSHDSDARLARIRGELATLRQQQQQARGEIAALASPASETRVAEPAAGESMTLAKTPAAPVPAGPALQPPSIRYYAQPWPDSRPIPRRVTAAQGRQVTVPSFAGLQPGMHAILR